MKRSPLGTVKSKKELLELQRVFAEIIRRPLKSQSKMVADSRTGEMIRPTNALEPHQRLQLYAQQYWWRIQQAFDDDFPTLALVLGEKKYVALRDAYLLKNPSQSFTLRNIGSALLPFLKKNKALTAPKTELAFDAAAYNWARIQAFDAASLPPLTLPDIQTPNFVKKTLRLQPYVQLLALRYDLASTLKAQNDTRAEASSNTQLSFGPEKKTPSTKAVFRRVDNYLVFHRFEGSLYIKKCSKGEYMLLSKLQDGASLNTLLMSPAIIKLLTAEEIFALFQNWVSLQWLSRT